MDTDRKELCYRIITLDNQNYIIREDKVDLFIKKYERENKPKAPYKKNKKRGRR